MGHWGGSMAGGWSHQTSVTSAGRPGGGLKRSVDGWDDEELGKPYDHSVIVRLLPYLKPYRGRVALAILGRDGRQLKRVEHERDLQIVDRTKKGMAKAEKLKKKADGHTANAKLAAEKTRAILEARSEKDPDMDDLLSAFESARVRQQSS